MITAKDIKVGVEFTIGKTEFKVAKITYDAELKMTLVTVMMGNAPFRDAMPFLVEYLNKEKAEIKR